MIIIRADRAKGKTTELVKKANKRCMYIVCKDRYRARSIMQVASRLGLNIPFPITVGELPIKSSFIKEVLVDDFEVVLEALVGCRINTITTSCEIEELS